MNYAAGPGPGLILPEFRLAKGGRMREDEGLTMTQTDALGAIGRRRMVSLCEWRGRLVNG